MRILVAEDEEDIQKLYRWNLVDRGHEVILTSDGEECIKLYRQKLQEHQQQEEQRCHEKKTFIIIITTF
jgi:DNA-binding response OmpR family regulator